VSHIIDSPAPAGQPAPGGFRHAPPGNDRPTAPPPLPANIPTDKASRLSLARQLVEAGFSLVPPAEDKSKRPCTLPHPETGKQSWLQFQERHATPDQLQAWYGKQALEGFGIVTGRVSGGAPDRSLNALDFDDADAWDRLLELARATGLGPLIDRLVSGYLERTPKGGVHVFASCPAPAGRTYKTEKLAERPAPPTAKGRPTRQTLVETKCEGGYVIVAPTPGKVHPSGKPYVRVHGTLATVEEIAPEEWEGLCALARSLDEMPVAAPREPKPKGRRVEGKALPGEDFAARTTWPDLLGELGWERVYSRGETDYYRRPDKGQGISASVNHGGSDTFYPFTTSSEFEPRKSYSKFGVYTWTRHGGDFDAAAKALQKEGYGHQGANGKAHHGGTATGNREAPRQTAEEAEAPEFSNFVLVEYEGEDGKIQVRKAPLRIAELDARLEAIAGGWPKRVVDNLFWQTEDFEPLYLGSSTRTFAWLDRRARVNWTKGGSFIPQERFYEHMRMTAERYEAIEVMPHAPKIAGIYYMHRPLPKSDGRALGKFVESFHPVSEADRELIKAAILTLFWGGQPGSRPAILITGPDDDAEQGRGVGKSKLVDIIADELAGGSVDVAPTDAIADVKTRLLSEDARQMRVVRLDNLKTHRFSWADLEGLITASEVSGRQLYRGEGRRPNTLCWWISLNGASLSKDMAQRVVPIKVGRPKYRATWEQETRDFAREHRWEIIGDALALLQTATPSLPARTRWATWEQGVLAKTAMPLECQALIAERQGVMDDDRDEQEQVADHFRSELRRCGIGDPDGYRGFILSGIAANWLSRATRTHYRTNQATAHLAGLGIPELRKSKRGRPGWIWSGKRSNANADPVMVHDPEYANMEPAREDGEPAF
jgi:hypothetical protein